jgi:short-subunit dehydrogenase involved in D-alanine esterification of teichoic acids
VGKFDKKALRTQVADGTIEIIELAAPPRGK